MINSYKNKKQNILLLCFFIFFLNNINEVYYQLIDVKYH